MMAAAERSGFSCRFAALANATMIDAGRDSKTQKSADLARRKAVSYNPVLARRLRPALIESQFKSPGMLSR